MKKVFMVAFCLLFLFNTLACQPTPEEDAVVNKGEGSMQEKILAVPVEEKAYEAPATVQIDTFGSDTFEVEVDAEVVVPDVTKYPVAEIEERVPTNEWVRTIMEKMADGKPIYSYETEIPQTKESILKEITALQEMIANPDAYLGSEVDNDFRNEQVDGWKEDLKTWEEAYKNAPDTFEAEEIDLSNDSIEDSAEISGAVNLGKKRAAYVSVYKWAGEGSSVEFNNIDDDISIYSITDVFFDYNFTDMHDISIGKEEAVQIGLSFLESLGETGFSPSLILNRYGAWKDKVKHADEERPQFYKIYFTRSVENVPTTYRISSYDIFLGTNDEETGEAQYVQWYPPEYVEMIIRDSGVNYMYWQMPSIITKVVNENVELLSFDEIMERFKGQVLYEALPGLDEDSAMIKKKLVITRIQLGMMQVRKKDSSSTLLMIPTWTFFGKTIQTYDGPQAGGYDLNENNEYIEETPGYSYLILNAIDGSVINPLLGY